MYDVGTLWRTLGGIVDSVVLAARDWERAEGALGMVRDDVHVGREERLVVVVDSDGGVGPPEERLDVVGTVHQLCADLDQRARRAEPDAVHALHAGEGVVVRAPRGDRALL